MNGSGPVARHARLMLVLVTLLLSGPAAAQEAAGETPYRALYQVLSPSLKLSGYSRLRPIQRIVSKDPAVPASEIRVRIEAGNGPIELTPAADGRVEFPMSEALLAENPPVRSNQPRGSLSVSVSFEIDLGEGDGLPYAVLAEGIDQAQQALAEVEPGLAGHRVAGIEFSFPPDSDARVQIIDPRLEALLMADRQGHVRLRNDPRLRESGASVRWSPKPLRAVPYLTAR